MNYFAFLQAEVIAALDRLAADGRVPAGLDAGRVATDPPREAGHGDAATNAALALAGAARMKPRDLAAALSAELLAGGRVAAAEVAGPGFVNLRLPDAFWRERLAEIVAAGTSYGDSAVGGGQPVNVEFVSANPTGPMHIGHARGAVVGDALANLLAKVGYRVTREYYINDAGAQVDALAWATAWRYLGLNGVPISVETLRGFDPEDIQYKGDYLLPVAQALIDKVGDQYIETLATGEPVLRAPLATTIPKIRDFTIDAMMVRIKSDLAALGVRHDRFSSERDLVALGRVDQAVAALEAAGLVYTGTLDPPKGQLPDDWEPRPQLLFRSSQFGDDSDRPLRKSDGSWTYFATDIAYHFDKVQRGFERMIDVWGADHGGYVKRVQAAVGALTGGRARLDVRLCQMVNLLRDGQPVRMSKRSGDFVTLRELVDEVGKDVVRFIMLTRKNDAHLDFDLAKVVEETRDNPVFYVQYAHARAHSVRRHAAAMFPGLDLSPAGLAAAPLDRLTDPAELALIRLMAGWPRLVEGAAEAREPHRIAFFLNDLAAAFHGLWNKGRDEATLRFLHEDDEPLSRARLALVTGVATVIASGLQVMGVTPVEEMR